MAIQSIVRKISMNLQCQ